MTFTDKLDIADLSILLVEPSKTQAKVISHHLKSEGISKIEIVYSATECLSKLENYQPDLIISSLYLPDSTATDLVIQVKNTPQFNLIPFMLISSETRFSALDPIRQAGVVAILPKPFSHQDLKRALKTSLEFIDPEEVELSHYEIEQIRVLLVDDSAMARKHIARVLNNMGIEQITQAVNGKEAIEIFSAEEDAFDLIVTDYNMPEMDGQELIEHIRKNLKNAFIPILMVTSEDNETRLNNIHQAGVSGICDKPFEPQTVKDLLCRLLDDK